MEGVAIGSSPAVPISDMKLSLDGQQFYTQLEANPITKSWFVSICRFRKSNSSNANHDQI